MKVLFDVEAISPPLTGIGRYAFELARGLKHNPRIEEVGFYGATGWVKEIDQAVQMSQPIGMLKRHVPATKLIRKIYHGLREVQFKMGRYSNHYDLYHSPNYRVMPFKGKTIATYHDLSVERFPEFHPPARVAAWHDEIKPMMQRQDHIIVDSEFCRQEMITLMGIPEKKVTAVPLGVDPVFQPYDFIACEAVMKKYGLAYKGFCLSVSTIEPRKNLQRLLKAYEELPEEQQHRYPLVLVGLKGWLTDAIDATMQPLLQRGVLIQLGYVDEADLPKIYASAKLFAYPSLYEGFGLPVLEAMASGTVVLTSRESSIPELAGEACVLVDPLSVAEIAMSLREMLGEDSKQRERIQRGLMRAQDYTWQHCVDRTIDVYQKVIQAA
jgi:glycosyltransferase involved in cell wall biosynthesis